MERLTKRELLAGHYVAFVSDEDCFDMWSVPKKFMGNAIDRLAAIEDILGDTYDLDRLRELVEADKAGRCVVLPCKVGDRVFVLHNAKGSVPFVTSAVVAGMHVRDERAKCGQPRREYLVVRSNGYSKHITIDKIGKTVFITREAAEAALAKEAK